MSQVWPFDEKLRLSNAVADPIRPFKCLILMPFEKRFDQIANIIKEVVLEMVSHYPGTFSQPLPRIERLDWETSTGVIQQEIWQKIFEADLVFCDITGYNPNVMFETGVCAAWKEMKQVVLIKDQFFQQPSAFNIAPIRYTGYQLTSDGISEFKDKIVKLTNNVLIGYPDGQGSCPGLVSPIAIDFSGNRDDVRIYTPPFAHRRVLNGELEFGSLYNFPHSWASVGKTNFQNFVLEFSARFSNTVPNAGYIGVGFRSQHYYANFAHILYLTHDGRIIITEPNEEQPNFYTDNELRTATPVDIRADHRFRVLFNESILEIQVDDFHRTFQVAQMKKVFGPGMIRFQSHMSWMSIKHLKVEDEGSS
jgi:hypothetical protein